MGKNIRRIGIVEDIKWLLRKCGLPILMLLLFVIVMVSYWGKLHDKEQRIVEEVWEPPVKISESETEMEETESSSENVYWIVPQSEDCLFSDQEKEELQNMALSAAEFVSEKYKEFVVPDAPQYSSGIAEFSSEQRREVVEALGEKGLTSVEEETNMQNRENLEQFYAKYLSGQESMVTVYEVQRDGLIGSMTFLYRSDRLQSYYVGIRWKEEGLPDIQGTSVSDIEEIKLTEKGYFIYAYKNVIAHASLRQYWRTTPLSDECRKLTETYISGLSYVNYNVLVTDWDSSNVEDILMPCMFEDIYQIYTGENLRVNGSDGIPANIYEEIMTTCFPVSVEQLRKKCGYNAVKNSYTYEMIYASPYPPFGEVVDYKKQEDGTIILYVDGVWADYNSDYAFTNEVVVQPLENGKFRYLSNLITQKELELPPIARTKG